MLFLGIDPGLKGALALLRPADQNCETWDMPTHDPDQGRHGIDPGQLNFWLTRIVPDPSQVTAWVERQIAMPRQSSVATAQTFEGYGIIKGVLACHNIVTRFVEAAVWKRDFGLLGKEKKDSIAFAQRMLSGSADQLRSDGRAEAALVAIYGFKQSQTIR